MYGRKIMQRSVNFQKDGAKIHLYTASGAVHVDLNDNHLIAINEAKMVELTNWCLEWLGIDGRVEIKPPATPEYEIR